MDLPSTFTAKMLFELGKIQVFHYPTEEEILERKLNKDIYWQDVLQGTVYGPFPSLHEAMKHYVYISKMSKYLPEKEVKEQDGQVIFVDFIDKRKVEYHIPGENDV